MHFRPRPKTASSFFDVLDAVSPESAAPQPAPTVPEVQAPPSVESVAPAVIVEPSPERRDYVMAADPIPSGLKSRVEANLAAIRLSRQIAEDGRLASPEEKEILARYSGFGPIKEVLNDSAAEYFEPGSWWMTTPGMKDKVPPEALSWKKNYERYYNEFKALLTEDEWSAALQSTLNAHYTPPAVARKTWEAVRRMGFKGGKVLEPAFGANGVMIGTMPPDLRAASKVRGTELDELSARIAQQLYPQCEIEASAFQDALIPDHSQDLVITNVPFSDTPPSGQTGNVKLNLHNFFIAKSMEKLKPGGLAVIITSSATLQNNRDQRQVLAGKVQLLGAIRLPSGAFKASANTDVVADILFLRKADRQTVLNEPFVELKPFGLAPEGIFNPKPDPYRRKQNKPVVDAQVNEYFYRHPEMVLGFHSMNGKLYGGGHDTGQYMVETPPDAAPLEERLTSAILQLPADVPNSSVADVIGSEEAKTEQLMGVLSDKIGGLVERDGKIFQVANDRSLVAPPWRRPVFVPGKEDEPGTWEEFSFPRGYDAARADVLAKDFVALREAYKKLVAIDLTPVAAESDSEAARAALGRAYDDYRKKWGPARLTPSVETLLCDDPEFGAVCSLEDLQGDGKEQVAVKAAIFRERTLFPTAIPTRAETIQDGVMISLGQKGEVVPAYVGQLCGRGDDEEGVKRLIRDSGLAFENPETGRWESRAQYLSGNVVAKLEVARSLLATEASLAVNVAALEAVIPKRVPFDQIIIQIGASWIPDDEVTRFAHDELGQNNDFKVRYYPQLRKWAFLGEPNKNAPEVSAGGYGTKAINGVDIFEAALAQREIRVTLKDDGGQVHFDEAGSRLANQQKDRMGEAFIRWIKDRQDVVERLENTFNHSFNNMVAPEYNGEFLTFPDLSRGPDSFVPRKNQKDAVARGILEQAGLYDHKVGFGKTLSLILTARESKRLGLANKPMLVCYNSNYGQFVDTIRRAYPQASILVANADSLNRRNRNIFLGRAATGNWDMVVVAQSHFDLIPCKPETEARFLEEQISELKDALATMTRNKEKHVFVSQVAKQVEVKEARLKDMMEKIRSRRDDCVYWEDLGVDLLLVDEIDAYKKVPFTTNRQGIKGIDSQPSQRATNLYMKARYIQDRRGGRGLIGATGTPISNTMAEAWNMMRLTNPNVVKEFQVETFDQFCSTFCVTVTALELNEANNRWKYETRLAKFINGPVFINFIRCGWDVKQDAASQGLNVPKLDQELKVVALTDEVSDQLDELTSIYDRYQASPKKQELTWVTIMLLQVGKTLSVDPRLIDPTARDNPHSVVNCMVADAFAIWKAGRDERTVQAIFLDQYGVMNTSKFDELKGAKSFAGVSVKIEDADELAGKTEEQQEQEAELLEIRGQGRFNLYRDVKAKLVALGVPKDEIVIINEISDPAQRKRVFDQLNEGEKTFVIGSTQKLGTGNNFQKNLIGVHHLDAPRDMTPRSLEQRTGRVERPGNRHARVFSKLWGMQDSVMPGVYQRILRKDAFIKQALAGKGVGLEFEDCGAVDLRVFVSNLVSDKRVLRREELHAAVREEKMQRELTHDRARNVADEIYRRQQRVDQTENRHIPFALQLKAWFEANVTVPPVLLGVGGDVTADSPRVRIVVRQAGVAGEQVFEGPYDDVSKEFHKELLEPWKKLGLPTGKAQVEMGTIVFNGLPFVVQKSIGSVIDNTTYLYATVKNPLTAAGGDLSISKFGSMDALAKLVQVRFEEAASRPDQLTRELEIAKAALAKIGVEQKTLVKFDETRLNNLQTELFNLEEDMRLKPVKRKKARSPEVVEVEAVEVAVRPQLN